MKNENLNNIESILACPSCKGKVTIENDKITCNMCGMRYKIRGNIPVMLIDKAENCKEG